MKATQIVFLLVIVTACNQTAQQQQEEQKRWEEMMAIHDEVMPKMADINALSRQLKEKLAVLDTTQTEAQQKLRQTIEALSAAEDGMMTWMAEIEPLSTLRETKKHEEIMTYLAEELKKVTKVKEDMLRSIELGQQALQ